eukprot:CAMPEP_0184685570 /NCGR_PEP_ID=MMETSP0312-20130426/19470_1 /TAXON_ID=31354 /ORGANISM="Compsopogon coeruleus, Strain SAG 36.94" /LENGTH=528 /DNA_ID=CAMNT_0027139787 /DNA_START=2192 /DNA_END=3778 /DNA_ORIENTATION=+
MAWMAAMGYPLSKVLHHPAQVSKIINGTVVSSDRAFPFFAGIMKDGKELVCGGALVGPTTVVSAAHCFFELAPCPGADCGPGIGPCDLQDICQGVADDVTDIALGLLDLKSTRNAVKVPIAKAEIHESFSLGDIGKGGDVAVLTLKEPVDTDRFKPIPVNIEESFPAESTHARVVGFGRRSNLEYVTSRQLRELSQDIVSPEHCKQPYKEAGVDIGDKNTFLCAVKPGQLLAGVCNGDSGGPLIAHKEDEPCPYLVGIVSRGIGICGYPGFPDVYTKVSHYSDFINQILERNNAALDENIALDSGDTYRLIQTSGDSAMTVLYRSSADRSPENVETGFSGSVPGFFQRMRSRIFGSKTDEAPTPVMTSGPLTSSSFSPAAMTPRPTVLQPSVPSPTEPISTETASPLPSTSISPSLDLPTSGSELQVPIPSTFTPSGSRSADDTQLVSRSLLEREAQEDNPSEHEHGPLKRAFHGVLRLMSKDAGEQSVEHLDSLGTRSALTVASRMTKEAGEIRGELIDGVWVQLRE